MVYWMAIEKVSKGVLTKINKKCFNFSWTGKRFIEVIPLVKWSQLAHPKNFKGWGLKNIYIFSKTLAAKNLWRLVYNEHLWGKVMKSKYVRDEY
jgi:hypothetical protein